MNTSKKNSGKKYGIITGIAVIVIILIALVVGISIYNSPSNRLSRLLDLGQQYLEEQNYEQAIVEFDKVIAIDPKNADAYLGKAEAYEGMNDYEMAIATLEEGSNQMENSELSEAIVRVREVSVTEKMKAYEGLEYIFDYNIDGGTEAETRMSIIESFGRPLFLTYKEAEECYRPLAEKLEDYVELLLDYQDVPYIYDLVNAQYPMRSMHGYQTLCAAYEDLFCVYSCLNELDQAVFYRDKCLEMGGSVQLLDSHYTYDQYGRVIEIQDVTGPSEIIIIYEYNENNQIKSWAYEDNGNEYIVVYEYASDGRVNKDIGRGQFSGVNTYEYPDKGKVLAKSFLPVDHLISVEEFTINQYGSTVNRTVLNDLSQ